MSEKNNGRDSRYEVNDYISDLASDFSDVLDENGIGQLKYDLQHVVLDYFGERVQGDEYTSESYGFLSDLITDDVKAMLNSHLDYVVNQAIPDGSWDEHLTISGMLLSGHQAETLEEIVELVQEYGADIHVMDDLLLRSASMEGRYQVCDYLVSQGADPQIIVDDENIPEANKQWAVDFVKARDLANKLTNDLAEKSSKADRLVSSIDEDAEAPAKQTRSTKQKI